jgi:FkbM family methyltransferase
METLFKEFTINEESLKCLYKDKESFDVIYKEICEDDCYKLTDTSNQEIDHVFDIGANIGLFSLVAKTFFKESSFICVEPNDELEYLLNGNAAFAIKIVAPFGNPTEKRRLIYNVAGDIYTDSKIDENGKLCIGLNDLISKYASNKYLIKIDTQGAESVLFNNDNLHKYHFDAINNSEYTVIEIHNFPDNITGSFASQFKNHNFKRIDNLLYIRKRS